MKTSMYLAIFIGGATGGLLREWLVGLVTQTGPVTTTLLVNTAACLLLGWLSAARHRVHRHVMHLAAIGFCGGLSTFSSFAADIAHLSGSEGFAMAGFASVIEVGVGLGAAALGLYIGHALHGAPDKTVA